MRSLDSLRRYFTFLTECKSPKACTILLRGPSKDILNEIDRNLADAMSVARNVVFNPTLAPGGGATEMAISVALAKKGKAMEGVEGAPFRAVADALEVIPRTLVQNCGGNAIRVLTELRVSVCRPGVILWQSHLLYRTSSSHLIGQARKRREPLWCGWRDRQGR
jgi:chaperonin GroEL (HSP60 family)